MPRLLRKLLIKLAAVDLDGDWAVHDRAHEHHRAKGAGFDLEPFFAEHVDDPEIEPLGFAWFGSAVEGGAPSAAHVTEQRELRNDQHCAADVRDRQRHLSLVVRKDAQARDLVSHVAKVLVGVFLGRTQVDEQAPTDRTDDFIIDANARFVDPLNDGSHAVPRSTPQILLPKRSNRQYSDAMKPVVGLTGGIASGKTTVAKMFADLGVPIIDADDLAREVVEPGTPGLQAIVDEFGEDVLDQSGRLDRKKVGELVFGDEEARETLNAILHPRIGVAGAKHIQAYDDHPAPYVVYEAALLVETGAYKAFPVLVVVSAEESVQRLRLIARDGYTVSEANARIESQLPLGRKIALADHVVTNNGDLEGTRRQVGEVHEQLTARFGSKG